MKTYRLPNGLVDTMFVDNDQDSVQVFAITADNMVVTVSQFRPGSEAVELELPGGGLEPGEDRAEAAARELREETAFVPGDDLVHLCSIPYSPYSTGTRHSYLAQGCKRAHDSLDLDPNEFLSVKLVPMSEFRALMRKGAVRGFDVAYLALDRLSVNN